MSTEAAVSKIRSKMVLVTPDKAKNWLRSNTINRDVRQSHVDRLASDMASGRWLVTHQGVAFNCDGTLLDGQHRLLAIIQSGTSQWMCVTNGLPANSISAIDDHQKRSTADSLKIVHGVSSPNINRSAAAAAWMVSGVGVDRAPIRLSRQEQIQVFFEHEKALGWAHSAFNCTKAGLCRSVVLAVIARAYYTVNKGKLEQFCRVLADPSATTGAKVDQNIFRLRDYLMTSVSGGASSQQSAYKKTERVLKSWLDGEVLSRLTEVSIEMFPTPAEKAAQ